MSSGYKWIRFSALIALAVFLLLTMIESAKATERAWLGVYLSDHESRDPGDVNYGARVDRVVKDSPADKAGLKEGDIIIKLENRIIRNANDVTKDLRQFKPGDNIQLEVVRGNKNIRLTATLAQRPESEGLIKKQLRINFFPPSLGVEMQDMNEDLAEYFNVKEGDGVLVSRVLKDSPAEKAGLKAGDVIIEFDGKKISKAADLSRAIRKADVDEKLELIYIRKGQQQKTTVVLEHDKRRIRLFEDFEGGPLYFTLPKEPICIEWDEWKESLKEKGDRLKKELPGEIELKLRTYNQEAVESLKEEIDSLKLEVERLKEQLEKQKSK